MEFRNCLNASNNDDMQVDSRHWLYMILRMQDKNKAATDILEPITEQMNIIENDAYHLLLLFYQGLKSEEKLTGSGSAGSSEAVKYGIANWYYYNNDIDKAIEKFQEMIDTGYWAGFGYIAAEAQLSRMEID